jgi:hypothetical protein
MFSDVEPMFSTAELKFNTVEHTFNVAERSFLFIAEVFPLSILPSFPYW